MATTATSRASHEAPRQAPSQGLSREAVRKKPVPELVPTKRRFGQSLLDLVWLVKTTVMAAPVETALHAAAALVSGLMIPIEMWATQNLVDNLAMRVEGGAAGALPVDGAARTAAVWGWFAVVAGVLIVERILYALEPVCRIKARDVAGHNLEAAAMRKASRLELIAFENQPFYDQMDRVMQGSFGRGPEVVEYVIRIAGTLPALAGFAVVLATYAPVLLVISLVAVLASEVTLWRMGQSAWKLLYEQTRTRRLADYFASALTSRAHVKEVRVYGLSRHFLDRWSSLYWQTRNEQRRLALRHTVHQRLMIVGSLVAGVAGFWWVVSSGLASATPGEYAILFRALFGMWTIGEMALVVKRLGTAAGYAGEFRAFMNLPEEGEKAGVPGGADAPGEAIGLDGPNASNEASGSNGMNGPNRLNGTSGVDRDGASRRPGAPSMGLAPLRTRPPYLRYGIRFEDVWFTYPGTERPVLAGVSFEIRAAEKVALIGENGAGKSTLVKLLLGFYQPDHGRITLDGVDIREIAPRELRRAFSAIFQQAAQYNLRLIDNVVLSDPGRPVDLARVEEAARRSGLSESIAGLGLGFGSVVGPDVGGTELSGGQWQRVALARAFYRQAEILILDEPTAALDPKAELDVFRRFVELAEDRTAVLISHRMGMARLADRIVVLRDGRVVETGTHEELMALGGEYAVLFEAQARWYR